MTVVSFGRSDDAPARCDWQMPADARIGPGERCVEDAGHEDGHVIADRGGRAVSYWRITDPVKRTAKMALHADLRSGATLTDEESWAMWAYFTLARAEE